MEVDGGYLHSFPNKIRFKNFRGKKKQTRAKSKGEEEGKQV